MEDIVVEGKVVVGKVVLVVEGILFVVAKREQVDVADVVAVGVAGTVVVEQGVHILVQLQILLQA